MIGSLAYWIFSLFGYCLLFGISLNYLRNRTGLAPDTLIERPGKNVAAVLEQAKRLLVAENTPASLLLITDGADTTQPDALKQQLHGSALQVLVLAVGSTHGGIIRDASGQPRTDSTGRPELGSFDQAALKQLAAATDAPLGRSP